MFRLSAAWHRQHIGHDTKLLHTTDCTPESFGLDVQVATQQGKYLAQVLKDNPMILCPSPNGPTVTGVLACLICLHAEHQQSKSIPIRSTAVHKTLPSQACASISI